MSWNWGGSIGSFLDQGKKNIMNAPGDAGHFLTDWMDGGNKSGHTQQQDLFAQVGAGIDNPLPSRQQTIMNVLNEQLQVIKKRQAGADPLGTMTTGDQAPTTASSALFGV